jgi:hypothetical protein
VPLTSGTVANAAAPHQGWVLKLAVHYLPPSSNRSQYTTVLVAGRAVWFFGGSNFGKRGVPEVERRTNGMWQSSTLPSRLQSWITGASAVAPDDIWAATYLGGKVLHWNGSTWRVVPKGRWNPRARFTGIVALGPRNVWLFGSKGGHHAGAGTWHLTGTRWTQARGVTARITRASATSSRDIWGIGNIGGTNNALVHFKNNKWLHEQPSALAGFIYSSVLVLGPSNVWVSGTVTGSPEIAHFDGHVWTSIIMPSLVPATAMCRDGRRGLWVIANSNVGPSFVLDLSAKGTWTSAPVSSTSADEVLACALLPGRTATWGAGKASAPQGTAAAAYGFGKVR